MLTVDKDPDILIGVSLVETEKKKTLKCFAGNTLYIKNTSYLLYSIFILNNLHFQDFELSLKHKHNQQSVRAVARTHPSAASPRCCFNDQEATNSWRLYE